MATSSGAAPTVQDEEPVQLWSLGHGFSTNLLEWKRLYAAAKPYPHLVIDDFLPRSLAEEILSSFPADTDPVWDQHGSRFIVEGGIAQKRELSHKPSFPRGVKIAYDQFLFSSEFKRFLSDLTGQDLYVDVEFHDGPRSGGLNAADPGSALLRHIDFNYSSMLGMYRSINVIIYLNKDWSIDDGGNLELWDAELLGPPEVIIAKFNRCLIFETNSKTYHGYGAVTSDRARSSLNLYFYAPECPRDVDTNPHRTIWRP